MKEKGQRRQKLTNTIAHNCFNKTLTSGFQHYYADF